MDRKGDGFGSDDSVVEVLPLKRKSVFSVSELS